MLVMENVTKTVQGQTYIYPTDLTLQEGTMNVLLGPTLSGKTTLMRLMAGLDVPNTGRILWNGKDVTGVRVQDRKVAMVYQQFINYPSMTVYDNIASPLQILGEDTETIYKRVHDVAGLMQLSSFLDRKPLELSGGQQQRCALARALVKNAGLVLLDEPLANLDYKLREELREEIPRIFEATGSIFVYATTEPEEALLLGGQTAILWEGDITQFGPTAEVYRHPANATTARVFSDPPMNFMKAQKKGKKLTFEEGQSLELPKDFSDLSDGNYTAGFRPYHAQIQKHTDQALQFDGRVSITEFTGSESYFHVDLQNKKWVALIQGIHDVKIGTEIKVWLDPSNIYLFDKNGELAAPATYMEAV